jgi:hypothetical protein
MAQRTADDYNLTLPPHSLEEMEEANAKIRTWHDSGVVLSETPIDALTTSVHQTLETARRLLHDLATPATAQAMPVERKQRYPDTFRGVLEMHAESKLDVAGLRAKARSLAAGVQEGEAVEIRKVVAGWTKLATMLLEKEDLMKTLAEKVAELEAEKGFR